MAEAEQQEQGQQQEEAKDAEQAPDVAALQAELERVKGESRKWEARSKENRTAAQQAEAARLAALPEAERAVEAARQEARREALAEVASARVADAVKLAAAGRPIDVDTLLEGLDRARFITDNGEPDATGIQAFIDKVAPAAEVGGTGTTPVLDLGQGARGKTPALNDDDALLALITSKLS